MVPDVGTGVSQTRTGKVLAYQTTHPTPIPTRLAALAATLKLATPELRDRFVELFKTVKVVGNTVVSLPTPNHTCQPATCLTWGVMAAALKLFLDRCQRPTHSRSHRDPLESESLGSACLPAYVRETQEIKRLTLTSAFPFASSRATATKLDQASLHWMKI